MWRTGLNRLEMSRIGKKRQVPNTWQTQFSKHWNSRRVTLGFSELREVRQEPDTGSDIISEKVINRSLEVTPAITPWASLTKILVCE